MNRTYVRNEPTAHAPDRPLSAIGLRSESGNEHARSPETTGPPDAGTDPQEGALPDLPVDVLGARICALASRIARATFVWLQMVAEFDRREGWGGVGIKSCAHWISWTCSMAPGTAREHVRVARALRSLPLVGAEMAAGRLSYAKVREITRVAGRVDEAELVSFARTATASQLARSVRAFQRADGGRARQEQSRRASWFVDDDGSVVLTARLPTEEGASVVAALEAARDDLQRQARPRCANDADGNSPKPSPPDPADMLLQWARGYLAATPPDRSGEGRTTVVVHVAAEHLVGRDSESDGGRSRGNAKALIGDAAVPADACQVAGVGGIEPNTAIRLACDATVVAMIRGSGGAILAHGHRRRLVSAAQRRALQVRDGGCQFPGCSRTSHLEAHHVRHWSRGGRTNLANLILLCRFHHVACHEGGVEIRSSAQRATSRTASSNEPSAPGPSVPAASSPAASGPTWAFIAPDGQTIPTSGTAVGPADWAATRWADDDWLLWHGLDGSDGWKDAEAQRIRPMWAGERFSLDETVYALFRATGDASRAGTAAMTTTRTAAA